MMSKFDSESFESVYANKIVPRLGLLETNRKKAAKPLKQAILFPIVGFVLAMIFNSKGLQGLTLLTAFVPLGIGIYFGIQAYKRYIEFKQSYKLNIVGPLLKSIDDAIAYQPSRSIPSSIYHNSELFLTGVDRYTGDDYFEGTIGSTDFAFSELHTQYKTESRDSKGNRRTTWHTIFRGIFMTADFHKEIKSETFVLPDQAESLFGNLIGKFFQSKNFSRDELVKMEDAEFEKHFVVYSDDQTDARYILTPDMMTRILGLRKSLHTNIHLAFKGTRVYIAISFGKTLFEPTGLFSELKKSDIEEVHILITTILAVVDDLNLNTRIWTKA